MRTERSIRLGGAGLGLALLGLILGCSDSVSPPEPLPAITGTVTTTDSLAVSGASILVSYRPSFPDLYPAEVLTRRLTGALLAPAPIDSVLRISITDVCGDTVAILCDGDCADIAAWDGRDEEGLLVVEGFYTYSYELPDTTLSSRFFLVPGYDGWDPAAGEAHARTDGQGRFSLTDECLSFGEELAVTGPDGVDTLVVTRVIDLCAVHPDGRQARLESTPFPEKGTLEVHLVIPD
jgi:hypothetical protein